MTNCVETPIGFTSSTAAKKTKPSNMPPVFHETGTCFHASIFASRDEGFIAYGSYGTECLPP